MAIKLSFVIPCYRSENTIEKVVEEISEIVAQRADVGYEIICVNDCSPDDVSSVLRKLSDNDKHIKIIEFAKNSGKPAAVLAGCSYADGDIIVSLDDDFQCPVNNLWKLVDPIIADECDVSSADYFEKKENGWKRAGSGFNNLICSVLLERPKELCLENFFAVKKYVIEEMVKYTGPYPYIEGLLLRVTRRIKMVPMEERNRADGKETGFTFRKSVSLFSNGLTSFSVKPLRISTIAGFLTAVIGFVWAIALVVQRLKGNIDIAGYTSTLAVLLIIGGLILMSLGLLGEYIGRMFISMNNSPQYVIKETINCERQKN